MNDLTERFVIFADYLIKNKAVGSSKELASKLGVSASSLTEIRKGRTNVGISIIQKSVINCSLNSNWLISGEGEMLKESKSEHTNTKQLCISELTQRSGTGRMYDNQMIPLYDINASAGIVEMFSDANSTPLDHIMIPNLSKVDGAVHVVGDSMYPVLKSGDIILVKQVFNMDYISYGNIYLLSFNIDDEEYICVKYVQKSEKEGCIKLVSHNSYHSDNDISIDSIRAFALVKASIRYNVM